MKTYIGDSIYAEVDTTGTLTLTTENGYGPTNEIIFETRELQTLIEWLTSTAKMGDKIRDAVNAGERR